MATEFSFTDATSTGTSGVLSLREGDDRPRGSERQRTIYVTGITDGEVEVQIGPTSSGPWVTPTDGTLTADGAVVTPAGGFVRLEITTATDVDVAGYLV